MKTDLRHAMEEQRDKARKARKVTNYMGADATVYESIDPALQLNLSDMTTILILPRLQ